MIPIAWFLAFPAVLVLLLTPIQLAVLPTLKEHFGLCKLIAIGLLAAIYVLDMIATLFLIPELKGRELE